MTNKAFRDMKVANCKNPVVVQFWKEIAEKARGEADSRYPHSKVCYNIF
jgi:hypothetical protein